MKVTFLFIILFIISCTTPNLMLIKNKYSQMNEIWKLKVIADEIKKIYGENFMAVETGIIYNYPNSKWPKMGLFFDYDKRLHEQFIFLSEVELQAFKNEINCAWVESDEIKIIAHYYRTIQKGICSEFSI